MNKKALIIPCYNEEQRLPVEQFVRFIQTEPLIHLWFVNDGSKDNTLQLIERISKENPDKIFVLDLPQNMGKAEALRFAFLHLSRQDHYRFIGFADADLSAPLSEAKNLFTIIEQKNILMATGARVKMVGRNIVRSLKRHYISRIFATYYCTILGLPNYDTQCGLKVFDRQFSQQLFNEPFISRWFFDLELFIRAKKILSAADYEKQISEVPLDHWEEVGGSRLKLKDFLKAPFEVLNMHFKYKNK